MTTTERKPENNCKFVSTSYILYIASSLEFDTMSNKKPIEQYIILFSAQLAYRNNGNLINSSLDSILEIEYWEDTTNATSRILSAFNRVSVRTIAIDYLKRSCSIHMSEEVIVLLVVRGTSSNNSIKLLAITENKIPVKTIRSFRKSFSFHIWCCFWIKILKYTTNDETKIGALSYISCDDPNFCSSNNAGEFCSFVQIWQYYPRVQFIHYTIH